MKETFSLYFPSLIIIQLKYISQLCSNKNVDKFVLITYRYTCKLIVLFPRTLWLGIYTSGKNKISLQIDTT